MKKMIKLILAEFMLVVGACVISYGAHLIHNPSGFIVGGLLLIIGGVTVARAA